MKNTILSLILCSIALTAYTQNTKAFQGSNTKWGLEDENNKVIVSPIYDQIDQFIDGLAKVKLNDHYGFINNSGKIVVAIKYDFAQLFYDGFSIVGLSKKWGIVNKRGEEITPFKYDEISRFCNGIALVKVEKRYGYINDAGKEITPIHFCEAPSCFTNGYANVKAIINGNQRAGIIDSTGKEIVPIKYYEAYRFSNGLSRVRFADKWGFVDKNGNEVIPLQYDYAHDFSDGLAGINVGGKTNERYKFEGGKWGFIDTKGKVVIAPKYDELSKFSEGIAAVKLKEKWGFIDKSGKKIAPNKYATVYDFSEGLAVVSYDRYRFGVINTSGKEATKMLFEPMEHKFSNGRLKVKYLKQYGYILKNGEIKLYDWMPAFDKEGMAKIKVGNKYGFIDTTFKEIIPLNYNEIGPFVNGLACVRINDQRGYIDKTGKEVIPLEYSYAFDFNEGLAVVASNGKFGVIDTLGRAITPFKYYNYPFFKGYFIKGKLIVRNEEYKYGVIDKTGKEIIPLKYDEIKISAGNPISIKLNDKWGYLDENGNEYIYDKLDEIGATRIVSINGKYEISRTDEDFKKPVIYNDIKKYLSDFYVQTEKGWQKLDVSVCKLDTIVYDLIDNGKYGGIFLSKYKSIAYTPAFPDGFSKTETGPIAKPAKDETYYEIHSNGVIFFQNKTTKHIGVKLADGTIFIQPDFKNVYPAYLDSEYSLFLKSTPANWEFSFTTLSDDRFIGKVNPITKDISGIRFCKACFGGSNSKEVTQVIKGQSYTYSTTRVQTLLSEKFDMKTGTTTKTYGHTSEEVTRTTPDKVETVTIQEDCKVCKAKGSFPVFWKWNGTKYVEGQ